MSRYFLAVLLFAMSLGGPLLAMESRCVRNIAFASTQEEIRFLDNQVSLLAGAVHQARAAFIRQSLSAQGYFAEITELLVPVTRDESMVDGELIRDVRILVTLGQKTLKEERALLDSLARLDAQVADLKDLELQIEIDPRTGPGAALVYNMAGQHLRLSSLELNGLRKSLSSMIESDERTLAKIEEVLKTDLFKSEEEPVSPKFIIH